MKKLFSLVAVMAMIVLFAQTSFSQLNGSYTIPGSYATISAAVTALNTSGVSGPVVFNVAAGHTETSANITLTNTTPNSTNTVTFQKSGAGANPLITAAAGTSTTLDGIIKFGGTDYVTFDGIDVRDPITNTTTTTQMEWGYAVLKASATDASQNIIIRNCVINVNTHTTIYTNTKGIYTGNHLTTSTTSLVITAASGTISNCQFYSNTINTAYVGIELNGYNAASPYTLYDQNNDVGVAGGNTINSFGGSTTTAYGVYAIYQNDLEIENNTIVGGSHATFLHTSTLYGIFLSTGTNSNADLHNNTVTLTSNSTTSTTYGIANSMGSTGTTNTINMTNNTVQNCVWSTVTSGQMYLIYQSASAYNVNVTGNTVNNFTAGNGTTTSTGTIGGIYTFGGNTTAGSQWIIANNTVTNISRSQSLAGIGTTYLIYNSSTGRTFKVYNNNVNTCSNNSTTGVFAGLYFSGSASDSLAIYSNTIHTLTKGTGTTTGALYGIYASQSSPVANTYNNTVYGLSTTPTTSTNATYGYYNNGSGTTTENFVNNTFYNFSSNGTGLVYGALCQTGGTPNKSINSNTIYNITAGTGAAGGQAAGMQVGYTLTASIFKNKIYNIASYNATGLSPATFGLAVANSGTTFNVYNNFIQELKAPNATVAPPSTSIIGIMHNIGAANVFNNTVYLDAAGTGLNFGTSAVYSNTTYNLDMRNNIIINKSTPNGTGLTVAYQRSSTTLTSYQSSSDRNNFYAGTPGASNLLYYDGTNSDQTLTALKTRVTPRDANSVSENTAFVNTSVSPYDLHLASCSSNQLESNASVVSTPFAITDDFDGNARYPNAGYPACSTFTAIAPDIGADEFGGNQLDASAPVISYTALGNIAPSGTRSFTNVTITDASGVNVTAGTKPRCYYKKSTDMNTYAGNTFFDNGWKWVESNGASSPYDFTIDYSILLGGSVSAGDIVQYFVTAQDLAGTPNVGINSGTFAGSPASVADYGNIFPLGGTINQYNISALYSGVYTVGTTGFDNFTTLTGAGGLFAALNAGVMTGNITAQITTDLVEDGANDLNGLSYDVPGANYTLKIVPSAATVRLISGSSALGLIRFDGNDYVTIDGNNGLDASGTQYLRFRNTNGTAPTFSFFNDSRRNTLTNCIIESNNTNITTLPGTILFGTTTGTDGNDSNTVSDCEIRDNSDLSGTPTIAVFSSGTTSTVAHGNSDNVFTGNNIHDFFTNGQTANAAFYLATGTTTWTISNNHIYQTSTRTTTIATGFNLIFISNSLGDGFTITGNYIGGTAPNCGGTPFTVNTVTAAVTNFVYIIRFASSGVTNASTISNNTIANFDITLDAPAAAGTLYFDALLLSVGNINVTGNTIGSQSANDNIKMTNTSGTNGLGMFGIDMRGAIGSVTNNTVGGFTYSGGNTGTLIMVGINEGSTATTAINVTGNTIGGTVSNSMYDSRAGVVISQVTGIRSSHAGVGLLPSFSNNTVRNLTAIGTGGGFMTGISHSGTSSAQINSNTITNLNSASSLAGGFSGTLTMCGISLTSSGLGASISNNTISNINNTYTGVNNTYVHGMQVTSSAATVTENANKIYGLTNQSTGTGVITGINQYWGAAGCTITNNQITITNGEATLDNAGGKKYINNHDNLNPVKQNPVELQKSPVNQTPVHKTPVNNIKKNTGEGSGKNGNDKNGNDKKGGNGTDANIDGLVAVNEEPMQENVFKENTEPQLDYTNGLIIYGMYNDATGVQNIYYNSVYVGGSASAGATNSYTFRKAAPTLNLINNLFVNARTNSGTATGKHYVVYSTSTTAGSLNANYNVYIGSNASTIGLWNTTDQTFAQWKTSLARDQQSWSTTTADINPSNLFSGIGTGNLNINTANTEAWIVSGKGMALTGQSTDYTGDARIVSVGSGVTDIGSDEFGALGMNTPTASVDNPPGDGVISTYTLWGRPIFRVTWGSGGSVYPTSLDVYYNSGIVPPNTLGGNYSFSHTIVNSNGLLTGTTYDITYYFGDNETYTIGTPGASTILAKYGSSATWEVYHLIQPNSNSVLTYNTTTQTFNVAVAGLWDFSTFALTDDGSALPVTMESFDITVDRRDAYVNWVTASELNNRGFGVERRAKMENGYSQWKEIGFVTGNGTSNERHAYTLKDPKLVSGVYQYRLRQVDFNNNVEYFNPTNNTDVIIGKPGSFDVSQNYPNPSNPKSKIDFALPFDGKVSIKVYDILGREVATLINDFKPADFYTVEFDGTNIASGTYFYRIIAEGDNQKFTKTLKMILVK